MNLHEARRIATELMQLHGLAEWSFAFDHARRRFGKCDSRRRLITLSRPLTFLNQETEVRDTILHEIAHALTPGEGHGMKWRAACRRIGARPQRCYTDDTVVSTPRKEAPYRFGCAPCGWWIDRRRRVRSRYICAKCRGPLVYEIKTKRVIVDAENLRHVQV